VINSIRELFATLLLTTGRVLHALFRACALGILSPGAISSRSDRGYQLLQSDFEVQNTIPPESVLESIISWKGKQILDLGCGQGREAIYFAKEGAEVTGVDNNPEMIEMAAKNTAGLSVTLLCEDYLEPNFSAEQFDIIYFSSGMYCSILQSAKRKEVLTRLLAGLHSDGQLILTIRQLSQCRDWRSKLFLRIVQISSLLSLNFVSFEEGDDYAFWEPCHSFTREELVKELGEVGVEIQTWVSVTGQNFHIAICRKTNH
jgi:SAM-dependent methyltransferase